MQNKIQHVFKESLKQSDIDEQTFITKFQPSWVKSVNDYSYDFITPDGLKVELKVEKRCLETGNLFFEVYSDREAKSTGGTYTSIKNNVDIFVIWIYGTNDVYYYDLNTLHDFVSTYNDYACPIPDYKLIKNIGCGGREYTTEGFTVHLSHVLKYIPRLILLSNK